MQFIEKKRNRFLAVFFGLLSPGFGQLYNGELKRAAYFFGAFLLTSLLFRSLLSIWAGFPFACLMLALAVGIWIGAMVTAFLAAGRTRPVPARGRWLLYAVALIGAGALLATGRKLMPAETFRIPADSMAPTALSGDVIMVNRWAYRARPPERGDVIAFLYPKDERIHYLKRVIAVPGDKVAIQGGKLFLNGAEVAQTPDPAFAVSGMVQVGEEELRAYRESGHRILRSVNPAQSEYGPVEVPPGKLVVFGDNRDRSSDSRVWGFVPAELVVGKATYVLYSLQPETHGLRPDRFGLKIN